ncbi:MAG TPA: SMP-30/gluconolactonase/LRE family protein [Candidatus Sulfopaludibacter sp.]|jgi:gluconolactonase|nr:SMP-30/gluconolactonase/LRE family protein [Candidatus Sulfopaludibacter sp.]
MNRRAFLTTAALTPLALAQTQRDWTGKEPIRYTDPDVISLDKRFDKYKLGNAHLERVWTGAMWAEGCAWSGQGRYLVWSDIPNNRQLRYLEEDGHVSTFRVSDYSNGNTFDYEGRQISCQHGLRRVVRFDPNGATTVIADKFNGKPLNSPNDVVVHPDGAIWFTDPPYGILGNYEGFQATPELKEAVYRVDSKTGKIDKVTDELDKPNGICFSPDYKKAYICDTGDPKDIQVFDVVDGKSLRNKKQFTNMKMGSHTEGSADGIRADIDGNIWAGAGWAGAGYDGVHIFSPEGQRIGQIVLPEICANLCFGGSKRNRLFMAASQSLYSLYVGTRGAHIA